MTKKQKKKLQLTTTAQFSEMKNSFEAIRTLAQKSLSSNFKTEKGYLWIKDMFIGHPTLGNCVIVVWSMDMSLHAVGFSEQGDIVVLAPTVDWRRVKHEYNLVDTSVPQLGQATPTEVDVSEDDYTEASFGEVLIEEADLIAEDKYAPLTLTLRLIKKGFGNGRDNHFYTEAQLESDAPKFVGAMMYTTNHITAETNERNQVAKITESWYDKKYNGILAKAIVFDPNFARKTRNRSEAGVLEELHCSIKAKGTSFVKPIVKGGRTGRQVKEFTEVKSVDFVSRGGAHGKALRID